jgi:hypothetical protein
VSDFDPLAYVQQKAQQAPPAFDPLAYASAVAADPSKQVTVSPLKEGEIEDPEGDAARALAEGTTAVMGSKLNPLNWPQMGADALAERSASTTKFNDPESGLEFDVPPMHPLVSTALKVAPLALGGAQIIKNAPKIAEAISSIPEVFSSGAAPKAAATVSDQILSKAQQAGYVVPPATTNPTVFNRTLEGIAGKANVAQAASVRNQAITNALARRALGLPEDAPLTSDTLDELRSNAGQSYEKVSNAGTINVDPQYHADISDLTKSSTKINKDFPSYQSGPQAQIKGLADSLRPANDSMDASTAVELSKDLRFNANANDSVAMRTGDPTAKAMGRAQRDAAEAIEDQVQRHLTANGQPDLADEWNQARTQIAKSYTVQKALDGAGNVDATKLGRALKNKNYNDELQTAGDFANAFPKAARVLPGKESMPGMSPLDVYGSVATSIAAGNPLPMLMGPGRMVARKLALSGQKPTVPLLSIPDSK